MSFFFLFGKFSPQFTPNYSPRTHTHTTTLFYFDMSTYSDFLFLLIQKQLFYILPTIFLFLFCSNMLCTELTVSSLYIPHKKTVVSVKCITKNRTKRQNKKIRPQYSLHGFLKKKLVLWYFSFKISISSISSSTSCLVVTTIRT